MNIDTIEQAFGAAARFSESMVGRGFQARVSKESGVDSSNLNSIVKKDKGASERARRAIFKAILLLAPELPARTYEDFLSFGQWLLDGNAPEDWKPAAVVFKGTGHLKFAPLGPQPDAEPPNISPGPDIHPSQRVPIISWVQAGDWQEVYDPFQPGYAEEWIDTAATNHQNAFALRVHGDSMAPEFVEDDIITVDPGREPTSGSFIIAKNGHEATFKQLVIDGSSVYLKPLNDRYPVRDVTGQPLRIVGVVVEKRKRY